MTNDELDQIAKALSQALHHEKSATYRFFNNDYERSLKKSEMSDDPIYARITKRIWDDLNRIEAHHNELKRLLRCLVEQAKLANLQKRQIYSLASDHLPDEE